MLFEYHKGELLGVQWDGGPISVYVDDAEEDAGSVPSRSLDIRASWVPGTTRLVFMDYDYWRTSGIPEHRCQKAVVESNAACFDAPRAHRSQSCGLSVHGGDRQRADRGLRRWRCGKSGNDSERATTRQLVYHGAAPHRLQRGAPDGRELAPVIRLSPASHVKKRSRHGEAFAQSWPAARRCPRDI